MKILHIIPNLNSGGAEKMLVKIIENDKENNHTIITLFKAGFYKGRIKELDIELLELNILSLFSFMKKIPKLKRLIIETDYIHSWMYYANLFGFILKLLFKKKLIWNIRRSYIEKKELKKLTYFSIVLNRLLSSRVEGIIYNSYVGKEAHTKFGFNNHNTFVISNGFEILNSEDPKYNYERNNLKEKYKSVDYLLCNVARWEPLKDHTNLLEAVSLLKGKINFHLILCGKNIDSQNQELTNLIKKLGLEEHVTLLGERKDVDNIMKSCDLYISSSKSEGFPNVLGEAMRNNLLAIATDAGDSKYILGNEQLIIPICNSIELANKVETVLSFTPEKKEKIILDCQNRITEKFNINEIVKNYNEIYRRFNK